MGSRARYYVVLVLAKLPPGALGYIVQSFEKQGPARDHMKRLQASVERQHPGQTLALKVRYGRVPAGELYFRRCHLPGKEGPITRS